MTTRRAIAAAPAAGRPAAQGGRPSREWSDYSRGEIAADAVIHVLSIGSSLMAVGALWAVAALRQDGLTLFSVMVYGVGVITVFLISAAYNLCGDIPARPILRRLDHAAIFIKIAGTYTPFALVSIGGVLGAILLIIVWGVALVGAPIKLFAPAALERRAVWLYLAQGWALVLAAPAVFDALSGPALALIVSGGLLYTMGVYFFLAEQMRFHMAIWHGFVLAASCCMYFAVLVEIGLAAP